VILLLCRPAPASSSSFPHTGKQSRRWRFGHPGQASPTPRCIAFRWHAYPKASTDIAGLLPPFSQHFPYFPELLDPFSNPLFIFLCCPMAGQLFISHSIHITYVLSQDKGVCIMARIIDGANKNMVGHNKKRERFAPSSFA
jgi:hypothetical protein